MYANCFSKCNPWKIPQANNIFPIFQMRYQNQGLPTQGLFYFTPSASTRHLPWGLPALTLPGADGALQR